MVHWFRKGGICCVLAYYIYIYLKGSVQNILCFARERRLVLTARLNYGVNYFCIKSGLLDQSPTNLLRLSSPLFRIRGMMDPDRQSINQFINCLIANRLCLFESKQVFFLYLSCPPPPPQKNYFWQHPWVQWEAPVALRWSGSGCTQGTACIGS